MLAPRASYARFHEANDGPAPGCDQEKAFAYQGASRKGKGKGVRYEFVELTGWRGDYARAALRDALVLKIAGPVRAEA